MRTYVSTLGFHETRVTRPVLRRGLDDDDVVVLLRPATETDDDRGSDAVVYVEDMLQEIAPGASIEVEEIHATELATAILECSDVLQAADGTLLVNLGGGPREVLLPFTIAIITHAARVDVALQYTDIEQQVSEWTVPNLTADVSERVWPTLALIAESEGEVSITDLTADSEFSKSTVTRHVQELATADLVTTQTVGNAKVVTVTTAGRLLLRSRTE